MVICWIITSSKQFIHLTTNLPLLKFPSLAHYNCFQHLLWSETIYYERWLNKITVLWSHLFSFSTWSVELGAGERIFKTSKERSFCRGCWWLRVPQLQQKFRHQFLVGIIIFICEVKIVLYQFSEWIFTSRMNFCVLRSDDDVVAPVLKRKDIVVTRRPNLPSKKRLGCKS